ncbi:hypothetical protein MTYP_01381 [Methylophilaceae bacterium]|nr:hypothetical protein MTYP_01381 [Methylophilaceae bacterium]
MQPEPILSPCIGVCAMNETTGLCEGCYRSMEEIRDWWEMAPEQRSAVMEKLEQRQNELFDFGD